MSEEIMDEEILQKCYCIILEDKEVLHIKGHVDAEKLIGCTEVQTQEMSMHKLEALLVDNNTVTKEGVFIDASSLRLYCAGIQENKYYLNKSNTKYRVCSNCIEELYG